MKQFIRTHSTLLTVLIYVLLYLTMVSIALTTIQYRQKSSSITHDLTFIDTVSASVDGGPWQTVTLPHTFSVPAPRTPVTIRATLMPSDTDCIYVKSVYAPAMVYLDDRLAYAMGQS